jgi:ribosomal protein S10
MFFYLKISSKDKKILKKFLYFFTELKFFPTFLKSFPKLEKRKFVTVLKSPHINKTAQEQFEYRYYSRHLLIHSFKPLTFILLLKKLKNLSFSGINFEIKSFFNKNKAHKHALQIISPDNIMLEKVINNHPVNKKKFTFKTRHVTSTFMLKNDNQSCLLLSKKYMQLFDLYGEIYLRKVFYF